VHAVRLLPMLAYTIVYLGTCLVGALCLLLGWDTFVAYFEFFSGTEIPSFDGQEVATTLALLIAGPLLLWLGYLAATYRGTGVTERAVRRAAHARLEAGPGVVFVLFALSLALALASLVRADALALLASWLHYTDWITARQTVFARLGFAEFVNLYLLLPLTAAWVALTLRPRGLGLAGAIAPPVVAVLVQLALFQKKAAIVAALVILAAVALRYASFQATTLVRRWLPISALAFGVAYAALVVVPVYDQSRQTVQTLVGPEGESRAASLTPQERERRRRLEERVDVTNRTKALLIYTALSPLTRTSAASLFYADVFPDRHPFYGLALGDGRPTDDTRVVWDRMNPQLPGGSVAVPFQFGLYALWGLPGALAACLVAGLALGALWRVVLGGAGIREWQALLGSLVVLLAIYLAIDSAQNSILVSYGVLWGWLFVGGALAIAAFLRAVASVRGARRSPRTSRAAAGDDRRAGRRHDGRTG
jgi:hypothetical protein